MIALRVGRRDLILPCMLQYDRKTNPTTDLKCTDKLIKEIELQGSLIK